MVNLVFLGPPGAGKGTQSAAIVERFGIPQISTGDLIREAIGNETELGRRAREHSEAGRLVPDPLVNEMVRERLARPDCNDGFLLDGYPRTVVQAEVLDAILSEQRHALTHVLLLDVVPEILIRRVTGRRSDPQTGRIYHVEFDPPAAEIADRVIQRRDDTEEVFAERLRQYHGKTAPLVPYYENAGLLRRIDGDGTKAQIERRIMAVIAD